MSIKPAPLLVFGAGGQVGWELAALETCPAGPIVGLTRKDVDIRDAASVRTAIDRYQPSMIINAAAYTAVDKAESEPEIAFAVNRDGPANIAKICAGTGIPLIHISTDYVFDGAKTTPYLEDDPLGPLNVYGASKLAGEEAIRECLEHHIILRTCWVFSSRRQNFVKSMLRLAQERDELRIVSDQTGCPTAAGDIAAAIAEICSQLHSQGETRWGTYHFCGLPAVSWHGFAESIFALAMPTPAQRPDLAAITTKNYPSPARRPANSALDCGRIADQFAIPQPDWHVALEATLQNLCSGETAKAM